ncbi:MAG TPA: flagellum-specific ATP synthase FliI, partial [Aquificaceae bacterium]|nr:flagellum-specific ATP synthase FliI [Aquificaceae bacterium]
MRGVRVYGKVVKVSGIYLEAYNPGSAVGNLVEILPSMGEKVIGEVIGFNEDRCIIMPYGTLAGIKPGDKVLIKSDPVSTKVGESLLGKVVNPFGDTLDGTAVYTRDRLPIEIESVNPLM